MSQSLPDEMRELLPDWETGGQVPMSQSIDLKIVEVEDKDGAFEESLYQRCKDYPYNTGYCCSYHEGMQDGIEIGLRTYRRALLASQTALREVIEEGRDAYDEEIVRAALLDKGDSDATTT